jgi:hypothetical protein
VTKERLSQLRWLEGSRLDDCQLVSTGRNGVHSLWLFCDGCDTFVLVDDIIDLWESDGGHGRAA